MAKRQRAPAEKPAPKKATGARMGRWSLFPNKIDTPRALRLTKRGLAIAEDKGEALQVEGPDGTMRPIGPSGVIDALLILYGEGLTAELALKASRKA